MDMFSPTNPAGVTNPNSPANVSSYASPGAQLALKTGSFTAPNSGPPDRPTTPLEAMGMVLAIAAYAVVFYVGVIRSK